MSQSLIFRITDNGQFTSQELTEFFNNHTNYIAVKEYKSYNPDTGPHYHGWHIGDISKKTLIHHITTQLHCKGNEDYSLSQKEIKQYDSIDGYKNYTCKGEKQESMPSEFYNLEFREVSEYHKNYYLEQEVRKKANKEKSTQRLKQLTDYVKKELNEIYDNQLYQIPIIILQYYKDNYKLVSDFQVENYYHFIRSQIEPDYLQVRANRIFERINRH